MTVDGQVVHTASDGHLPQASHADVSGVQFDVWSNRQEGISVAITHILGGPVEQVCNRTAIS